MLRLGTSTGGTAFSDQSYAGPAITGFKVNIANNGFGLMADV